MHGADRQIDKGAMSNIRATIGGRWGGGVRDVREEGKGVVGGGQRKDNRSLSISEGV